MALWIADSERGLVYMRESARLLCRQAQCLTVCGDRVICAAHDSARVFTPEGQLIGQYPLPPGTCRMCALPDALYVLSSEADSVSLLCPMTGRLRLCAQAGCYPRDMRLSPCGRYLLIAGGAAGEALIFSAQDLTLLSRCALPGIVCAAAFMGRDVCALCAAEESDVTTLALRISPRGVTSEMLQKRGLPGAICALPDQTLLLGLLGETLRLRPDGRILQRYPGGLAQSIRAWREMALIADPVDGSVQRVTYSIGKSAEKIYLGASPSDVLLV